MISKTDLEERKKDLLAQKERIMQISETFKANFQKSIDDLNAIVGAIQDTDYWLNVIEKRCDNAGNNLKKDLNQ